MARNSSLDQRSKKQHSQLSYPLIKTHGHSINPQFLLLYRALRFLLQPMQHIYLPRASLSTRSDRARCGGACTTTTTTRPAHLYLRYVEANARFFFCTRVRALYVLYIRTKILGPPGDKPYMYIRLRVYNILWRRVVILSPACVEETRERYIGDR